jgi:UPF0755 protein
MEHEAHLIQDIHVEEKKPVSPHWRNRLGVILSIVFTLCVLLYMVAAPRDFPKGETVFTIAPGQNLKSVGTELKAKHYIQSRFVFATLVTLFGSEKQVPSGDYFFGKPVSVITLARQIAFGQHNLIPIKITIPEGSTVSEISVILAQKVPGFDAATFVLYAKPNEGYFFPETYFIFSKTDAKDIADEMRAMFDKQTGALFASLKPGSHAKKEIVIMASVIEREAHGTDDRSMISGILWNRIAKGMRLQVDATVAYAVGKSDTALQKSDFSVISPYNTYRNYGLPPGPISNPGKEALLAAISPTTNPYLYYLHDKHGTIHYAKTYAEHLTNIKKYL